MSVPSMPAQVVRNGGMVWAWCAYVSCMGTARVMMQHTRAMYVRVGVCAWLKWNVYGCVDGVNVFSRFDRLIMWWYVVVEFSDGIGFDK